MGVSRSKSYQEVIKRNQSCLTSIHFLFCVCYRHSIPFGLYFPPSFSRNSHLNSELSSDTGLSYLPPPVRNFILVLLSIFSLLPHICASVTVCVCGSHLRYESERALVLNFPRFYGQFYEVIHYDFLCAAARRVSYLTSHGLLNLFVLWRRAVFCRRCYCYLFMCM